MSQRYDQWRFVTIITVNQTYDFILDSIDDFYDLFISLNEALNKQSAYDHRTQIQKLQKLSFS